jgi:hypothetical protein
MSAGGVPGGSSRSPGEQIDSRHRMTVPQRNALADLCSRYNASFDEQHYRPAYGLPVGYVAVGLGAFLTETSTSAARSTG